MPQRVFSSQVEDTQQPVSNQMGGDKENSSEDEGPDDRCSRAPGAGSDRKQAAMIPADKFHNINCHQRTMLILFANPLLLKKKLIGFL